MSNDHTHPHAHCDHEVKWCRDCNVCYCDKCHKEWPEKTIQYQPYTWPNYPRTIWNTDTFQLSDGLKGSCHKS